jgi:hypothetical protein
MEEKHVMNDGETNDLRCSVEETLEGSACCETSVCRCLRGSDDNDTRENLGPEENGKSEKKDMLAVYTVIEIDGCY